MLEKKGFQVHAAEIEDECHALWHCTVTSDEWILTQRQTYAFLDAGLSAYCLPCMTLTQL